MPIIPCSDELMKQAASLIRSVFRWRTPAERMSFVVIRDPESNLSRFLMNMAGLEEIIAFDVYVDDFRNVLGTTGLYRYKTDAYEAVWLTWFCVLPKVRGQGIGQALLDHTVAKARDAGFSRIRLHTSANPNEAAAQRLYEKNGFREIGRKRVLFETTIYREKLLRRGQ